MRGTYEWEEISAVSHPKKVKFRCILFLQNYYVAKYNNWENLLIQGIYTVVSVVAG